MDNYLVQTQLQTKSSGIKLPEIHGVKKYLNPNSLLEKWKIAPQLKKGTEIKVRLGHDRAGIKWKRPQVTKTIDELTGKLQEMLKISATQNIAKNRTDFLMHEQSISNPSTEAVT